MSAKRLTRVAARPSPPAGPTPSRCTRVFAEHLRRPQPTASAAIESYEYSKQPMNSVAFESGAGTSLLYGPVLNPDGATGTEGLVENPGRMG